MKRGVSRGFAPAALTVGLAVVLGAGALAAARAVAIWLLCLAALFLLRFVRDVRTADAEVSSRFDAALRAPRGRRTTAPGELLRMEREIVLGVASADECHRRLLPLLRTAAAARLASSHGIDLARSPAAAHAALGDEAWEFLRPDRPEPANRHGRGVPRDVVAKLIAKVETL